MFYISAADKKNLQDLEEKYLDKELQNYQEEVQEPDPDTLNKNQVPNYFDLKKEKTDFENSLIRNVKKYQTQYNLLDKDYIANNKKLMSNVIEKSNDIINLGITYLNKVDLRNLEFFIYFLQKNISEYDLEYQEKINKFLCNDFYPIFYNIVNAFYIFNNNVYKIPSINNFNIESFEYFKNFYEFDGKVIHGLTSYLREYKNLQSNLDQCIVLFDFLNKLKQDLKANILNSKIYKCDDNEKILSYIDVLKSCFDKQKEFLETKNEVFIQLNNTKLIFDDFKNQLGSKLDNEYNNSYESKDENSFKKNYKILDFYTDDFLVKNLDIFQQALKRNPKLYEIFSNIKRFTKFIEISNNNPEVLKILNETTIDIHKMDLITSLFDKLNSTPIKDSLFNEIFLLILNTKFLQSEIELLNKSLKATVGTKSISIDNFYYILKNIKEINSFNKKFDMYGIGQNKSYFKQTISSKLMIDQASNINDKIKILIAIITKKISHLSTNSRLEKDLFKIFLKNKDMLDQYLLHIPSIFRKCIIYQLCNKDINYLLKNINNFDDQKYDLYFLANSIYSDEADSLIDSLFIYHQNINESKLLSLLNKMYVYAKFIHSCSYNYDDILRYLIQTNINISSEITKNFLNFISENKNPFLYLHGDDVKTRLSIINKDLDSFRTSINKYVEMFNDFKVISNNDQEFLDLYKICDMIKGLEYYEEYKELKKPKVQNLSFLNMEFPEDNLIFKVLDDNDTDYFTVGAATHCCQIIGGVGNNAAVDSFVNPVASVLILQTNDGEILAQSYFHYVPQDNGFILDNVEINRNNIKSLNNPNISLHNEYADLTKYYKALADKVTSGGFKYLKCGLNHNKLYPINFKKVSNTSEKDIRHFQYEKYTDFSPKNYLLLTDNNLSKKDNFFNDLNAEQLKKEKIQRKKENKWLSKQLPLFQENFLHFRDKRDARKLIKEKNKDFKNTLENKLK